MKIDQQLKEGVSLRMTDQEAETLILALQNQLLRRKALIALQADMANWNDVVVNTAGQLDDRNVIVSIGICAR